MLCLREQPKKADDIKLTDMDIGDIAVLTKSECANDIGRIVVCFADNSENQYYMVGNPYLMSPTNMTQECRVRLLKEGETFLSAEKYPKH